jgi:hypothetical protein
MNRKRLSFGIVLIAAAIGLVTGARHCLRMMSRHGGLEAAPSGACRPADCAARGDADRYQAAAALAA